MNVKYIYLSLLTHILVMLYTSTITISLQYFLLYPKVFLIPQSVLLQSPIEAVTY